MLGGRARVVVMGLHSGGVFLSQTSIFGSSMIEKQDSMKTYDRQH